MYIIRSITIKTSFLLHKNLPGLILGGYIYRYIPRRYGPAGSPISELYRTPNHYLSPLYQSNIARQADSLMDWRQRRRGCRGHIPSNILVGGRQWEYPHQYYDVRSDIADQYISCPRPMTAFNDVFYSSFCSKIQNLPQNRPKPH